MIGGRQTARLFLKFVSAYTGNRMGHARSPNAFAYSRVPDFGHVRQGRKTYRYPGGGVNERFVISPSFVGAYIAF